MRVRSFFWFLITCICLGILLFAATIQRDVPAILQVQLDQQQPTVHHFTSIQVHFTDSEGLPIDQAQIHSQIEMTTMPMSVHPDAIHYLGQGIYSLQVQFNMSGPWAIKVTANAHGFDPQQRMFVVNVV